MHVQGQGWVEAGSVGIGSSIVSRAGPALAVTALTWQKDKAEELAAGSAGASFGGYTVYNLTVEDDHTFFVGTAGGGTWVHNACKSAVVQLTRGVLKENQVLDRALEWLGPGYKESMGRTGTGGEGVFRSADNLRQFRMAPSDLAGSHGSIGSHVHFQAFDRFGNELENAHIQVVP